MLNPGPGATLLLIETDHDVTATRLLRVGDDYADGWKLTALSAGSATLTKGGVSRTFALLGRPASFTSQLAGSPSGVTIAAPTSSAAATSTILPPLRRTVANSYPATRVTNTEAMRDAILRGDVGAVMEQDGSAVDYLAVNVADIRGRRMSSVLEFHAPEFDSNPAFSPNWPIEVQGAPVLNAAGAVQVNGAGLSSAPRPVLPDGAGFGGVAVIGIGALANAGFATAIGVSGN